MCNCSLINVSFLQLEKQDIEEVLWVTLKEQNGYPPIIVVGILRVCLYASLLTVYVIILFNLFIHGDELM